MERLTIQEDDFVYISMRDRTYAIERLADIEDILGPTYDLDHLRYLVKANKEGRATILPCNIGDTVYKPWKAGGKSVIATFVVTRISSDAVGVWYVTCQKPGSRTTWRFQISEFGKTVFISHAEAEAALAALITKED